MCRSETDVFGLMTALPGDLGVIDLKFTSKLKFEFSLLKKKVRFIFHSKAEQYLQPGLRYLFHSQRERWCQSHLAIKGFSLVNFLRKSWSKTRRYCLSTAYINRPHIFTGIWKEKTKSPSTICTSSALQPAPALVLIQAACPVNK